MADERFRLLCEPGESLLLHADPLAVLDRRAAWLSWSGMAGEEVWSGMTVSVPLPHFHDTRLPGAGRRWHGLHPRAMRHPLMWLPRHIAAPFTVDGPDGPAACDPDAWAVSIALEVTAAGLYDPETGTWLDVLAAHGLSAERPDDLARVEAWLAGRADPVLDAIDLTGTLVVDEDPDWSALAALDLAPMLSRASWSLAASEMAEVAGSVLASEQGVGAGEDTFPSDERELAARSVIAAAADPAILGRAPATGVETPEEAWQWWSRTASLAATQADRAPLIGLLSQVHQRLLTTQVAHSDAVEVFFRLASAAEDDRPPAQPVAPAPGWA